MRGNGSRMLHTGSRILWSFQRLRDTDRCLRGSSAQFCDERSRICGTE